MSDDRQETYHYAAFLSYRHLDNREPGRQWANWLHQYLETYVVPGDLAGTPSRYGDAVPATLYPVFQDEKELPADASLEVPIRDALKRSRCLIVLCSPNAAVSRFVNQEIQYFKSLGRSDRILALMLAGEPNADDPGKRRARITPEDECFPEALRHPLREDGSLNRDIRVEPLAADVRPEGVTEGFTTGPAYRSWLIASGTYSRSEIQRRLHEFEARLQLAREKVVAGVLGVPLGDLQKRDQQRALATARKRQRAMLVATILLAGLASWAVVERASALRSRKEAVTARQSAEDLVAYLQNDLGGNLDDLGRLEMMKSINDRVRRYYREHPAPIGSLKNLMDVEESEFRRGSVAFDQGRYAEALEALGEAKAKLEALSHLQPEELIWPDKLILLHTNIGDTYSARDELTLARNSYIAARELAERYARGASEPDRWKQRLYVCQNNIGESLSRQGHHQEALRAYEACLATCRDLLTARPNDLELQRYYGWGLNNRGDALLALNQGNEAAESFRASVTHRQKLSNQFPRNAKLQRDLGWTYQKLAEAELTLGDKTGALATFQNGYEIFCRISDQEVTNMDWATGRFATGLEVANLLKELGPAPEALRLCRELHSYAQTMIQTHPEIDVWRERLARVSIRLASILSQNGEASREEMRMLKQEASATLAGLRTRLGSESERARWQAELNALPD